MTAVSAPPERSNAQRFAALKKANRIRVGRAEEKRILRRGGLDPAAILDEPGPLWEGCKAVDFLMCLRGIGRVKALQIIAKAGVSPAKTVGGMTLRQRRALYDSLCQNGPRGRFS